MNTLITGGTGTTGRRVASRLHHLDRPVRIGSRRGDPRFDWDDPASWAPALAGCTAAYVTFQPDIGLPGADQTVGAFSRLAVHHGVRRLVLLSGRGETGARRAEDALIDSGADWTILRSAFFMQNFTESFWAAELSHGGLSMVRHRVGEPFVDADDLADVVAAVLTRPGHEGRIYELTGPRLLTFAEAAHEFEAASGRPVDYRELDAETYAAGLVEAGFTTDEAAGLAGLFSEVLDGRNAHTTGDVLEVLGRPPRDFATFLSAAAGVTAQVPAP